MITRIAIISLAQVDGPAPPADAPVAPELPRNIYDDFWMFSSVHAVVFALAVAFMVWFCMLGRRWRGTPKERLLLNTWGGFVIVSQVVSMTWWCMPPHAAWSISLPLHLCDVAGPVAAWAILTRQRWARSAVMFWGLLLSSWGFFTPVLEQGLADPTFYIFWANHLAIVATAVYEVAAAGFRPTRRDTWQSIGLTSIWVLAMIVLNAIAGDGFNYGYVGLEGVDPINLLGPYPWRLIPLCLGVTLLMWGFGGLLRMLGPEPSGAGDARTPPSS